MSAAPGTSAGRELAFTRVFNAPRTLVFRAWADPKRVARLNTVTFAGQGGKTTHTWRARVVKSTVGAAPYLEGMEAGCTQSLERLEAYLAKA